MGVDVDPVEPSSSWLAVMRENFRDELLIALVHRLGGEARVPFEEIDNSMRETLAFCIVDREFRLAVKRTI
jgi:hypothetical protein